eukprot:TRINITY_DN65_c0_g2_i1.p1 TRINITY_DN65_c0_g2~~TRINITY_DN65_c0_g2_i1.p1  ORF type:complete len:674 (-),score=173.77 TRINITY_DN65_c0_g2_i1:686-2707(-)
MTLVDKEGKPKLSLLSRVLYKILLFLDKHFIPWHRMPTIFGLAYLGIRRWLMEQNNLIPVGPPQELALREDSHFAPVRDADGKYDDPFNPEPGSSPGSQFSFFGRLMPAQEQGGSQSKHTAEPAGFFEKLGHFKSHLSSVFHHEKQYGLLDPPPSLVANKLLVRKDKDAVVSAGDQFNMLAASWIQFNIHDWVDHEEDETMSAKIEAPSGLECPLRKFKFYPTKEVPTKQVYPATGHKNSRTAWWDGSAVYGQSKQTAKALRTGVDGKVILGENGLLATREDNGVQIVGDVKNVFLGVTLLQLLFMKEHNLLCDMLKSKHPSWDDEKLYNTARLIVAALIAKVHTIDWTIELLKTPIGKASLYVNWYGLLGKKLKKKYGHTGSGILSGLVGKPKADNHGVPYSLSEEFVSVYRMHALLVDELELYDASQPPKGPKYTLPDGPVRKIGLDDMILSKGDTILEELGEESVWLSFGVKSCGLLRLHNYPVSLRHLIPTNTDGTHRNDMPVDLAALEIWRDRERGVPRYNNFRRGLFLNPIEKWSDLTKNKEWQEELQEVYGDDVEKLDLMVGLYAEDLIPGYAISETSFHVFVLSASRRLDADRFYSSDYNAEVYSQEGMDWIEETEGLKDILKRHFPDVVNKYLQTDSAFNKWDGDEKPFPPAPSLALLFHSAPK